MRLFSLKSIQFNQILSDISNYLLSSGGPVKSINNSTIFGQLITVVAGVAHNIMAYIEDSLVEQNKYTAQRKKSILGLATLSGYQPSFGKAAGIWIKLEHKANNGNNLSVILQDHEKLVCSQNGLYYNLVLNSPAQVIQCSKDLSNMYFYAIQGRFETQRFVSSGGNLYVQNLSFMGFLDSDYINVKINGEDWRRAASVYDMGANEQAYTIRHNPLGGVDVLFGDEVHGKKLEYGDTIEISYLMHDGEAGNVETQEMGYFIFSNPLQNIAGESVDGNSLFNVTFATKDSVAAGSNSEDINVLKNMIGFNSRSMVLNDSATYSNLLNKYSFVGYNRTWSEKESLRINSIVMRNYKLDMESGLDYFNLKPEQFVLSDSQKTSIQNAISSSGQQLAGVTYNILDIELVKYALFIYIKMKDYSADRESVTNNIRKLVGEFFGDIQDDSYVPKSDVINLIKNEVPEVDGVDCYFLSELNEKALQERSYVDVETVFDPKTGTYKEISSKVILNRDENPLIGLDSHGNIVIDKDTQFPVLMGGWDWINSQNQEVDVVDPLTIIFE